MLLSELTSLQVWLESVPTQHITQLDVAADMDGLGKFVRNHLSLSIHKLIKVSKKSM